jgi:regulator of cell morphogenesis and NO signaling
MNNALEMNAGQSLGDLAAAVPAASRVLRAAGLDYCCQGKRTLAEACAEKGLDPASLLESIRREPDAAADSWNTKPLVAVISHILERYHQTLRTELPELRQMAAKVEEKHADKPACPRGLTAHLAAIHEAVLSHLEKEEQILFPMIVAGRGAHAVGPIQVMEFEHQEHGANLARTRELTADLTAPPEACATWQALYLRLRELESDLMDHIHLENHVLFPRALCE